MPEKRKDANSSLGRTAQVRPLLYLGLAVLFWGFGYPATKATLASFSPMTVIWMRMTIATIAFAPFWRKVERPSYRKGDWKILALNALLMPCLYFLFEAYGVSYTTSSQAGMISALIPLFVAAGAWLFLKERLSARSLLAIALSFLGVLVLSFAGSPQTQAPNPALGNLLEVLAMVCGAGWMILMKRLGDRYSGWFVTGAQAAVGAVFFSPGALASDPRTWLSVPPSAWLGVMFLGICVSLGAFGLYNTALVQLPATRASMAINLVPAIALLSGLVVLGEELTLLQAFACALIAVGVLIGQTGTQRSAVGV
jgi:drug/metabolite transporter (DMT)-like permease